MNIRKLFIVGAGPGDPDLITYKAIKALRNAEVVITDRLVSSEILERFVSQNAKIIFAGKQAGKKASTKQAYINQLMIKYALKGRSVVRLKGGDVSIFSNIFDELKALKQHHIPYEIVPGITAAFGAAAYSGIPLTARDFSSAVRFLSSHENARFSEQYWKELATTDDTLVFYMSGEHIHEVIKKLTFYRIHPSKQIAIVEQATTPMQNVIICNLYRFNLDELISPSLIIIGKVVNLHYAFKWIENSNVRKEYFKPIEEKLIDTYSETEIVLAS